MSKHKIEEAKRYLVKEVEQTLHHLQSGKAKLTPQSAAALASMVQSLEMTKLYEEIEEAGGIKHILEALTGGSHGSQGKSHQIGFGHRGGIYPYKQHPSMEHMEMRRGNPGSGRTRNEHDEYLDEYSDYDRYWDDRDAYDEMEARRRRSKKTGRFIKGEQETAEMLAEHIHDAYRRGADEARRTRSESVHGEMRHDIHTDGTRSDRTHSDGTRTDRIGPGMR